MKIDDKLKSEIINYEVMLQNLNDFSIAELSCLLDDDFSEIGQSGIVWNKEQVMNHFDNLKSGCENNNEIVMLDEQFKLISEEIILLTYKTKKTNLSTKFATYSLRSSLWKKQNDRWVMLFHQGTPVVTMYI